MLRSALLAGATLALATTAPLQAQRSLDCGRHLEKAHETIRDVWSFAIFKVGAFDIDASLAELLPEARAADNPDDCADVIDRYLATLRDGHANLTYFPGRSPRSSPPGITLRRYRERMIRPGATRPDQRLYVIRVDTTRAELAELPVGSQVLEVDGRPADQVLDHVEARMAASTQWGREQWADRAVLRGPAGVPVQIRIRTPEGEVKDLELERPEPRTEAEQREARRRAQSEPPRHMVQHRVLDNNIGYLRFTSFADAAAVPLFDEALHELRDTDGLVLDMRSNGGGLIAVLQAITGRFFESRRITLVRFVNRVPGRQTMAPDPSPLIINRGRRIYTKPLVLLVDAGCFSACDLFASVMDEQGRALIIGPTPTGGGSASPVNWASIPEFNGMRVRASLYVALRADGSHIEGRGIRPHLIVDTRLQDYIEGRDPLIERALKAFADGEAPAHP